MITVGILGGVGAGKSLVTSLLAELVREEWTHSGLLDLIEENEGKDLTVFNADRAGHDALLDPEISRAIYDIWGSDVFTGPSVDRKKLAVKVFSDGTQLKQLEALVHPYIYNRWKEVSVQAERVGCPVIILDAALLLEAGWGSLCDVLIYVDTPYRVRLEHIKKRGWTEEELIRREKQQMPLEEKKRRAHLVLNNSGTVGDLKQEIRSMVHNVFKFGK